MPKDLKDEFPVIDRDADEKRGTARTVPQKVNLYARQQYRKNSHSADSRGTFMDSPGVYALVSHRGVSCVAPKL